ncbi:hypothetical protein E2C01_085671 [Portunus trituberculatus]|uniref:Uncharacterized protein n=1 Tax=Portunus trituberculatus TaxID=210409 RepID=A0A5B7JEA2_PORTR|nr:hypothetical protein [Portunus trituberculatus]
MLTYSHVNKRLSFLLNGRSLTTPPQERLPLNTSVPIKGIPLLPLSQRTSLNALIPHITLRTLTAMLSSPRPTARRDPQTPVKVILKVR